MTNKRTTNGIFTWGGCENVFEVKVGETATHWLKRRFRSDSLASSDITNDVSSSSRLALEITSCAPALQSPATGSKVFAPDHPPLCLLKWASPSRLWESLPTASFRWCCVLAPAASPLPPVVCSAMLRPPDRRLRSTALHDCRWRHHHH